MITAEVAKLPTYGCMIVRASEITQTHTNTGCNQYNYTLCGLISLNVNCT